MSSLSTLLTKLRDEVKIDPNDKIWSQSTKTRALNAAYFQVQKDGNFDWPENVAEYTFSTVAGTREYAQPSDFVRLELIRFNGQWLDKEDKLHLKMAYSSSFATNQGTPNTYYVYGRYIGLDPIPNTTGTVDLDYRKKLPEMTSLVDCAFTEDFDEATVLYAAYKLFKQAKQLDRAKTAYEDYQLEIDKLTASRLYVDAFHTRFKNERRPRGYVTQPNVLDR